MLNYQRVSPTRAMVPKNIPTCQVYGRVYHGKTTSWGCPHPKSQHQVLSRRISSTILCGKDVYPKVAMCCHGKWWWTILGRPIFRPISQHPSIVERGNRNSRLFRIRQGHWSLTAAPAERCFDHAMKCFTCVRMCMHSLHLMFIYNCKTKKPYIVYIKRLWAN